MKYRKKPVKIEAVRYIGHGNLDDPDVPDWIWNAFENGTLRPTNGDDPLRIKTLEGELTVSPGDWIIKGIKEELYPCKPDIFEQTYEACEQDDNGTDGDA